MNRLRFLKTAHVLAAALLLASCSQDELTEQGTPLPVGQYPLELTAGGLQAVATPPQPATRGTMDGDWDGVERVTVMVNNEEEKTKEYKVEASEDKKTALLTPEVPLKNDDDLFWWTSTGERKTVTAWAPYEYVLYKGFELPTKWKKEDFATYDIIGVRKDIQFTDDPKSLEFRHLMAKVVINLRRTDYLEKAEKVDVQLLNMYKKGRLGISINQLEVSNLPSGGSSNITPYLLPAETYEEVDFGNGHCEKPFASYTALVVPVNLANTNVLQIAVDGTQYLVTKDALGQGGMLGSVKYTAGQTTTINLTVKKNELDVPVSESIGWGTDGATGSGEVELP